MLEKKTPGRPRLYSSSTDKVDAFRKRQESAGFVRKEILVTRETWEQVSALAKRHGVGVIDAASGLLEHGLAEFERSPIPPGMGDIATRSLQSREFASASSLVGVTNALPGPYASMSPASDVAPTLEPSSQHTLSNLQATESPVTSDANPITRFFAKRKDHNHAE